MMSGHGANPIFFNKRIKLDASPTSDSISFLPYPTTPPPLPPSRKVDVICVSPLKKTDELPLLLNYTSMVYCNNYHLFYIIKV